jgi:glyoxylase-like metal-dependent hydrolase (beta-lactamase superfamily II)
VKPNVEGFFDPATWTVTYVVHDGAACAVVDSVLDYEPNAGRTATDSADKVIAFVRCRGLQVEWILETHAHADHLSAAQASSTSGWTRPRGRPRRRAFPGSG